MNINTTNNKGESAFFLACAKDREDVVDILLEYGADINIENKCGDTPLICAAHNNNLDIVEMLLMRSSIDINHQNKKGETALIVACIVGNLEVINLLLEHDVDYTIKDNFGYTALMHACEEGHVKVVKKLADYMFTGLHINLDKDEEIILRKAN